MSRRFQGEYEEDAAKGRQRAQKEQARHDAEGGVEYAHNRSSWYKEEPKAPRPSGAWRFEQLLNSSGHLVGWRVELDGRIAGMLILQGDDIQVISTKSDDSSSGPGALDIMAAFTKLYPDPRVRSLPTPRTNYEFGPQRDWSED